MSTRPWPRCSRGKRRADARSNHLWLSDARGPTVQNALHGTIHFTLQVANAAAQHAGPGPATTAGDAL